ncbi:MAG: TolC family protein [Candidatus Marinimicrobia bacterium]|nr:TolC family protein [Candidatus Neomarinimicrobiota bacterium]MCF7829466.1 TolC family protein [Candidatus Neomarinimicrobiota bacterium]MCF7882345.1 TolC family protein [Candidatus Neomarinimicrobiota bacterium]
MVNIFERRQSNRLGKTLKVIFLLLILPFPLHSLFALDSPDTLTIDLSQAQSLAMEKNPQIQAAQKSQTQANSRITQARGRFMPRVSAFGSYTHNFELPVFTIGLTGQPRTMRVGTEENISTGIQVEQPIYLGGVIRSGYDVARTSAARATNQVEVQQQAILMEVRQTFYRSLHARQLIQVSREALRNTRRNLEVVQRQADLGTASDFDVLRAKVQVANTRPRLIAARHQYEQSLTALRTAIGLEPDQPSMVEGELRQRPTSWADSSLTSLQNRAYRHRKELENISLEQQIQEQNLAIARASLLPKISASTSWQYQLQNEEILFDRSEYYRSIAGGINISVPIFTGWQNSSSIAQARVALKQVDDRRRQVRHQIAAEVETAYYALVQAEEQLASQQETVAQARKGLELAEVRFAEGTATQLDILNAQLALQQAQSNESQYLLQYNIARDQLLHAMNMLKIES